MGRGDRRSRQGKIWRGTRGKYHPRKRKRSRTMRNARPPATAS